MLCLNCNAEMIDVDVATRQTELSYDMCEKCGSLWLDAGELDKMAFTVEGSIEACSTEAACTIAAASTGPTKKCPRCTDFALTPSRFLGDSEILLDHCTNCGGFWLKGGALDQIDAKLAKIMPVAGQGFSDFVHNAHVPYWNRRVVKPSAETDFHVDVEPLPGAELLRVTTDTCPVDKTPLNIYSLQALEFEACPKCNGLWLDKNELRKLKDKATDGELHWLNREIEEIDKAAKIPGGRHCARCPETAMVTVVFGASNVILDWCPKCHGLWLDRCEFEFILSYLREEAGKATSTDLKHELSKDVSETVHGSAAGRLEKLADTEAALAALINTTIFEHPKLFTFCTMSKGI